MKLTAVFRLARLFAFAATLFPELNFALGPQAEDAPAGATTAVTVNPVDPNAPPRCDTSP